MSHKCNNRPESPTVTLTRQVGKYKAHKLHQRSSLWGNRSTYPSVCFLHFIRGGPLLQSKQLIQGGSCPPESQTHSGQPRQKAPENPPENQTQWKVHPWPSGGSCPPESGRMVTLAGGSSSSTWKTAKQKRATAPFQSSKSECQTQDESLLEGFIQLQIKHTALNTSVGFLSIGK